MVKLTIFSKRVFFCHGFATTNHSYSIFFDFTLHLVVARSELLSVDYSDGCGSKSTAKFDVHLKGSGRIQTLLHNLCYCLPVVSTMFASLIIYTILWDGKWGSGGLSPPDVDSIFSKRRFFVKLFASLTKVLKNKNTTIQSNSLFYLWIGSSGVHIHDLFR